MFPERYDAALEGHWLVDFLTVNVIIQKHPQRRLHHVNELPDLCHFRTSCSTVTLLSQELRNKPVLPRPAFKIGRWLRTLGFCCLKTLTVS